MKIDIIDSSKSGKQHVFITHQGVEYHYGEIKKGEIPSAEKIEEEIIRQKWRKRAQLADDAALADFAEKEIKQLKAIKKELE